MLETTAPDLPLPPSIDPARDALFLDFDGTLVEIADRPDEIVVPAGLAGLLKLCTARLQGRLVIVSGRTIEMLDRFLGEAVTLAAGVHGATLRGAAMPDLDPQLEGALAVVRQRLSHDAGGVLIEDKGLSIALHYRERADLGAATIALARSIAAGSGGLLAVQLGRKVVEIKPALPDKGDALRRFLRVPLLAGCRPVFVGDDLTDEVAFEAAAGAGGHGVLVGSPRPTAARFGLDDVDQVWAWLRQGCA